MSKQIKTIVTLGLILVLIITNPSKETHVNAVGDFVNKELRKKMTNKENNIFDQLGAGLGLIFGKPLIDNYVDRENYFLFSLTKVKFDSQEKIIGIGILGNVYIFNKSSSDIVGRLNNNSE